MFDYYKDGEPYTYYSIREKLNYYKGRVNDMSLSEKQREKAVKRVAELTPLNKRTFQHPTMIVTDDKHFGNGISKPRGCVVVGTDKKGRLIVCPVYERTTKSIILDNDYERQVNSNKRFIDKSEVYELDEITDLKDLTLNDKRKIQAIIKVKK